MGRFNNVVILTFAILVISGVSALASPPEITVRHPKKNLLLPVLDSTFIYGQVTPGSKLTINGFNVDVYEAGGFLAFLPVHSGDFVFNIVATMNGETQTLDWPVTIAEPYKAIPRDSLAILDRYRLPDVYQQLIPGDLLEVSFRGTPSASASFRIVGLTDFTPMAENPEPSETPWGNETFGEATNAPAEDKAGIYSGSIYLPNPPVDFPDSAGIEFRLRLPAGEVRSGKFQRLMLATGEFADVYDTIKKALTVRNYVTPQVVRLKDSLQTIRTGPRKGYLSVFQPIGARFVLDGKYSNYYRLKLAPGVSGWVPDTSVIFLAPGTPVPHSYIKTIRCTETDDNARVEVFLDQVLPIRVEHYPEESRIDVRIYYGSSDTDWIKYIGKRDFVERITWRQVQDGIYEISIYYKPSTIWSLDYGYVGNTFTLDITPAPQRIHAYKDLRFVIDPGHSHDPGAIGPTGYTEAEANLAISDKLAAILRKKGATVFMTRHDDANIPLNVRPNIAREKDCDIFISVHNNSVPITVNPYTANGVSTYYYNAHSLELARTIQDELVRSIGLNDHGLFYGNFAVTRPTEYLAVLVECAFMILPEQEAALKTEEFQMKCASSIAEGIDRYIRSVKH